MIAHLSPLIIYVSQIYIIYGLFTFAGKFSHILRVLSWIIVSLVLALMTISVCDNTCLYYIMSECLTCSGVFLCVILVSLCIASDIQSRTDSCDEISRERGSVKDNHTHEVVIIVIVK